MNKIESLLVILSTVVVLVFVVHWILTKMSKLRVIDEINELMVRMRPEHLDEGESLEEYKWILEEMNLHNIPESSLRFSLANTRISAIESFRRVLDNHKANLERVQKELSDPKLDDTESSVTYKLYLEAEKARLESLIKEMTKELEEFLKP